MVKEVFKVVKNFDGILISAIVRDLIWRVEYMPNKWTIPHIKNSKLTCFDSFENAFLFIKSSTSGEFEIWNAEALDVENARFLAEYTCPKCFDKFWDNIDNILLWEEGELYHHPPFLHGEIIEAPKGTLYAGKLKLIKRVDI